jgi:hypothetical protein
MLLFILPTRFFRSIEGLIVGDYENIVATIATKKTNSEANF